MSIKTTSTLCFLLAGLLSSCVNKYDSVFDKTSDERAAEALNEYRNALLNAPDGWRAIINTGLGGSYNFYFKFNENGRVNMIADFNESSSTELQQATYLMKALQRPTLTFDTYSYIHLLSDPSNSVNGGVNGAGLISDFEFALEKISGDSIRVMGLQRNTPMILVKASAQEAQRYISGDLGKTVAATKKFLDENPYPYFETSGTKVAVGISHQSKIISLLYLNQNSVPEQITSSFYYSFNGLKLKDKIGYGNVQFDELLWDATQQAYYIPNGAQKLFLKSDTKPVIPLVYAMGYLTWLIRVDPNEIADLPPDFVAMYNGVKDNLKQNYNYELDLMYMAFLGPIIGSTSNQVIIAFLVHNNSGNAFVRYFYSKSISNQKLSLTFVGQDRLGQDLATPFTPLINYFKNNTFTMDYILGEDNLMAGVYPQQNPSMYFIGVIEE